MRHVVSSLIFAYMLQQRVSTRPVTVEAGMSTAPYSDTGDLFDRLCLKRLTARAYRYSAWRAGLGV